MSNTILITGGATRLGMMIAEHFASKDYNIAIHYNNSDQSAKQLVKTLSTSKNLIKSYQANLLNHSAREHLIKTVLEDFSSLNILINNASIFNKTSFLDTDHQTIMEYLNLHLMAPFFLIQYYAKLCKTGHVINITDTRITKNKTDYFPYLLSNKSLSNLTLMLATELAPAIKVNEICPGKILPSKDPKIDISDHILQKKLPSKKRSCASQLIETINFIINNNPIGQQFFVDGGEHLL